MRGYPPFLNTKEDYKNVIPLFPGLWVDSWNSLYKSTKNWIFTENLTAVSIGIQDSTHRVLENRNELGELIGKIQETWQEDSYCKALRIGLTSIEINNQLNQDLIKKLIVEL